MFYILAMISAAESLFHGAGDSGNCFSKSFDAIVIRPHLTIYCSDLKMREESGRETYSPSSCVIKVSFVLLIVDGF